MKSVRLQLLIVLALLLPAAAFSAEDYVVGQDDVLKITVYNHPDLTATERVSGEGVITLPLIGEVHVAGLTVEQVAKKITARLSDGYIIDPNVSVFVAEFKSKKTIIMGQVLKPGIYTLSGNTTFLELISLAGGLTREAGEKATIKRKPPAGRTAEGIITIDLKGLIELGNTSLDVPLMDGDSIFIARAGLFYITGEVRKPDAYKHEEGLTVIKAVTMAGGFTDKASSGRIKIIRKSGDKEKVIEKAAMDEKVLPDDIILVPESFF